MSWRLVVSCAALCCAIVGIPRVVTAQAATRLCSGGNKDGVGCSTDGDCPNGVCVIAQGVCDGGVTDGQVCTQACDDAQCVVTQRICFLGNNAGLFCLNNAQCAGTTCASTGKKCSGGEYDNYPCGSASDCGGTTCEGPGSTGATSTPGEPPPTTTPTPTRTATPAQSPTPTLTRGPTSTATPTPPIVHIIIGSATGGPGALVPITVSIQSAGVQVVATANDIGFDASAVSIDPTTCHINPNLGKALHASIVDTEGTMQTLRALVQAPADFVPIPDGPLYTCTAQIASSALPKSYALLSALSIAYDDTDMPYSHTVGQNGSVTVTLVGHGCIGDCNQDSQVTVDEIISGVNIALGNSPTSACPSFDANGDGEVTIDELISGVNNALVGCPEPPTPKPTATATETPLPTTLYVRTSGNDVNKGTSPDDAVRSISAAVTKVRSGYRVVVGPGTYVESVVTPSSGTPPHNLIFLADTTGSLTGDPPGAVIINAHGTATDTGFKLTGSVGTIIDGFTIIGGDNGVEARSASDSLTVQNCIIHDNTGAGIHVQDSSNVLVFNNLIYNNTAQGVAIVGTITGSSGARIFNNTLVGNGDRGITIGNSKAASPNGLVLNNILQGNGNGLTPPVGNIKVFTTPASTTGYSGDYNLVNPGSYIPAEIAGAHDITDDATFVFVLGDDFHLRATSPAIDAGTTLSPDLEAVLYARTATGGAVDSGRLDLGYHYPP